MLLMKLSGPCFFNTGGRARKLYLPGVFKGRDGMPDIPETGPLIQGRGLITRRADSEVPPPVKKKRKLSPTPTTPGPGSIALPQLRVSVRGYELDSLSIGSATYARAATKPPSDVFEAPDGSPARPTRTIAPLSCYGVSLSLRTD
jgi:hypothetical protein